MVKQYSEDFKKKAVSLLSKLRSEKFVMIDKKKVENVRDLVKEIGITPYSIYKWKKEIKPEETKAKSKKKRKGTIRREAFEAEQKELLKQKEARLVIKDLEKELSRLNQIPARDDPKVKEKIRKVVKQITKLEKDASEKAKKAKKEELMNSGREITLEEFDTSLKELEASAGILGGRFVGYIAQEAKISGYSKMKLPTLMLKVGQMYIAKSGRGRKA